VPSRYQPSTWNDDKDSIKLVERLHQNRDKSSKFASKSQERFKHHFKSHYPFYFSDDVHVFVELVLAEAQPGGKQGGDVGGGETVPNRVRDQ
jgi:hypothetical protein